MHVGHSIKRTDQQCALEAFLHEDLVVERQWHLEGDEGGSEDGERSDNTEDVVLLESFG